MDKEELTREFERRPGHWVLARLGKKILRPGGRALTEKMVSQVKVTSEDRVVEFGPGVGATAKLLLSSNPQSYFGVDLHSHGERLLDNLLESHPNAKIVHADAAETTLDDESATVVVGEAMLTMCSAKQKEAIIGEAFRILQSGGRYAIHELALSHDVDMDDSQRTDASQDLSRSIHVAARPLTVDMWRELLTNAGFKVVWEERAPFALLSPRRLIADEGILGALGFLGRAIRYPAARKRLQAMRASFMRRRDDLTAISFVAVKP